jgi:hypothetical protein
MHEKVFREAVADVGVDYREFTRVEIASALEQTDFRTFECCVINDVCCKSWGSGSGHFLRPQSSR